LDVCSLALTYFQKRNSLPTLSFFRFTPSSCRIVVVSRQWAAAAAAASNKEWEEEIYLPQNNLKRFFCLFFATFIITSFVRQALLLVIYGRFCVTKFARFLLLSGCSLSLSARSEERSLPFEKFTVSFAKFF
jgi:hypothetical protein